MLAVVLKYLRGYQGWWEREPFFVLCGCQPKIHVPLGILKEITGNMQVLQSGRHVWLMSFHVQRRSSFDLFMGLKSGRQI